MPHASVDGIRLYYEEVGEGAPLVFVHEFAGEVESWRPQVQFFARRYRTIAYNARGYPPSDVPDDPGAYSQERAVEDIRGVLDHLGIPKAHLCGLSMGGYAVLHFGGHDFACGIRAWEDAAAYERTKEDLLQRYASYTLADMVRGMDQHFPDGTFSLTHLFIEQRRHVLARVTSALLERYE